MDASLKKILDANQYAIKAGYINKACEQAEDYLTYILGHNFPAINKEMQEFVTQAKTLRKEHNGKRKKVEKRPQTEQRTQATTSSTSAN